MNFTVLIQINRDPFSYSTSKHNEPWETVQKAESDPFCFDPLPRLKPKMAGSCSGLSGMLNVAGGTIAPYVLVTELSAVY
jgi:hypothetical protein